MIKKISGIILCVIFLFVFSCDDEPGDDAADQSSSLSSNSSYSSSSSLPAPTVDPDVNMLANGDFSDGEDYWGFGGSLDGNSFGIINEEASFTTAESGDSWLTYFVYKGGTISLENWQWYEISFSAYGDERSIAFVIQEDGRDLDEDDNDWTQYINKSLSITGDPETYTFKFLMTGPSDDAARFVFHLAGEEGVVNIDDVIVKHISASIDPEVNMIANGDFSDGGTWWFFMNSIDENTFSVTDGEAQYSIAEIGTNRWDTGLCYAGETISLLNGEYYEVSFTAYGSDRTIHLCIQENGRDLNEDGIIGSHYSNRQFDITADPQTFTYLFQMENPDDDNAAFNFHLAQDTGDVVIDDVVLKHITVDTSVNMLVNGDFRYGNSMWSSWINTEEVAVDDISSSISDGMTTLDITDSGTEAGHFGISYGYEQIVEFEKDGFYELLFDMSSDPGFILNYKWGENGVDYNGDGNIYTDYMSGSVYPADVVTTFSQAFQMCEVTARGRMDMLFGGLSNTTVSIGNFILRELDLAVPDPTVNMVMDDGAFGNGLRFWNLSCFDTIEDFVTYTDDTDMLNIIIGDHSETDRWIFPGYGDNTSLYFENGKVYSISSEAYATGNCVDTYISIKVQENGTDYNDDGNNHSQYCIEWDRPLTDIATEYTVSFRMDNPSARGTVQFGFSGNGNSTVHIDNVVIKEIDSPATFDGTYSGSSVYTYSDLGAASGDVAGTWTMTISGYDLEYVSAGITYPGSIDQLTGYFVCEKNGIDAGGGLTYNMHSSGTIDDSGNITGTWSTDFSNGATQYGTINGSAD